MLCALRALLALGFSAALLAPTEALASDMLRTTATYYHPSLHGSRMANGEVYNRWDPGIAACNWYPLGTLLKVTRQETGEHIYVRIKDRGSRGLTLDLSEAGFGQLGGLREGRILVSLEVVAAADGERMDRAEDLRRGVPLLGGPLTVLEAAAARALDTPGADLLTHLASPRAPRADSRHSQVEDWPLRGYRGPQSFTR
jgi:rare lipoprotein A (peptidoglycan hydrolase)